MAGDQATVPQEEPEEPGAAWCWSVQGSSAIEAKSSAAEQLVSQGLALCIPQEVAAAAEAPSKWLQLLSSMWASSQPKEDRRDRLGLVVIAVAFAHQVAVAEWVAFDWRWSRVLEGLRAGWGVLPVVGRLLG